MAWPKGKPRGKRATALKTTTSAQPAPAPAQVPVLVDPDVFQMLQFASRLNGVNESAIIRGLIIIRKPATKM